MILSPELATEFYANTIPAEGGHLTWTGPTHADGQRYMRHHGRQYSATKLAYLLAHNGAEPAGHTTAICGARACILPAHMGYRAQVRTAQPKPDTLADDLAATPLQRRWRDLSACLDEDPERFFPHPGDAAGAQDAKELCRRCEVRLDCLRDALDEEGGRGRDSRFGIRGGTGPMERYTIYRRFARRAAKAAA